MVVHRHNSGSRGAEEQRGRGAEEQRGRGGFTNYQLPTTNYQ
ncbi:hypothetical protein [Chroococcidiopsis sp.]